MNHALVSVWSIVILVTVQNSTAAASQFEQQAYIKASNTDRGDSFGHAVAISGDTIVVGAYDEESAATGVDGDQVSNLLDDAGAAYVYVRNGTVWTQQAYLKASNTNSRDQFGISVDIDGDTIVVGAWRESSSAVGVNGDQSDNSVADSGAAYVFTRTGETWIQEAYLKASNTDPGDRFGTAVAISGDTIVVGATFERSSSTGVNGDDTDNSANSSGAAYVFKRVGSLWAQEAYLKASNPEAGDQFGWSVATSDGRIVVGAYREDSSAAGVDGDQLDNSLILSGAAYVFSSDGTTWIQDAYLKASNPGSIDRFGFRVAMEADMIAVGAPFESSGATGLDGDQADDSADNSGAVYLFEQNGMNWEQTHYFKAANTGPGDRFGGSLGLSGERLVVGASGEGGLTSSSGAAYAFSRSGATWVQDGYLKASNPGVSDAFGTAVAISAETIVVGALGEDSSATGVNGNESNNDAITAGAAYVFMTPPLIVMSCYGDGLGTACKCGNDDSLNPGTGGCLNSNGTGAVLATSGNTSISDNELTFDVSGAVPNSMASLVSGDNVLGGGLGILGLPESDGLRCFGFNFLRHGSRDLDSNGSTTDSFGSRTGQRPGIILRAGFVAGQTRHFQVRYREDPLVSPCGFDMNTTQAISVTFAP